MECNTIAFDVLTSEGSSLLTKKQHLSYIDANSTSSMDWMSQGTGKICMDVSAAATMCMVW